MSNIYDMLKSDVDYWVNKEHEFMLVSGVTQNQYVFWLMSIQKCIEILYVNRLRTTRFIGNSDWIEICIEKSQCIVEHLDQYLQIFIHSGTWETVHSTIPSSILSQIICNFIFNEILNIVDEYPITE